MSIFVSEIFRRCTRLSFGAIVLTYLFTYTENSARAEILDFTETFETDSAGFADIGDAAPQHFSFGGVNDSGFIRTFNDFANSGMGLTVVRAESGFANPLGDASNGAFTGNYIDANVQTISFDLRHDFSEALDFSVRFAPVSNFPGSFFDVGTVNPNQFQTLTVDFSNPSAFGFEGAFTFDSFFGGVEIGNIQIFTADPSDNGNGGTFNVDIDNFGITTAVPEPGSVGILTLCALGICTRRRRR